MNPRLLELMRFGINGAAATAVHYAVLHACIEWLRLGLAGAANFLASLFGISVSFLGNRYFVFDGARQPLLRQAMKFAGLYALIALLHGSVMWVWADVYGLNYHGGFVIAVLIQFTLGYLGGKRLVFEPAAGSGKETS
jgi:putative flippase GtrA